MTTFLRNILTCATLTILASACQQVNDDRIPAYPVRMEFNQQVWELYGVHTYGQHRFFDHFTYTPSGYFNFDPDALTGYGGILLVSGYDFENHDISMTTASLQRDLHCFNMSCSVVLAPYTSYNFSFRCNAATLTDALKYDKRSGFSNAVQWY